MRKEGEKNEKRNRKERERRKKREEKERGKREGSHVRETEEKKRGAKKGKRITRVIPPPWALGYVAQDAIQARIRTTFYQHRSLK